MKLLLFFDGFGVGLLLLLEGFGMGLLLLLRGVRRSLIWQVCWKVSGDRLGGGGGECFR